jgi:hypothetical protein
MSAATEGAGCDGGKLGLACFCQISRNPVLRFICFGKWNFCCFYGRKANFCDLIRADLCGFVWLSPCVPPLNHDGRALVRSIRAHPNMNDYSLNFSGLPTICPSGQ